VGVNGVLSDFAICCRIEPNNSNSSTSTAATTPDKYRGLWALNWVLGTHVSHIFQALFTADRTFHFRFKIEEGNCTNVSAYNEGIVRAKQTLKYNSLSNPGNS